MKTATLEKRNTAIDVANNLVLLKRKNKIFVEPQEASNSNFVKAMSINIASLGYMFSPELAKALETIPTKELSHINNNLVKDLSNMVGSHVKYNPLFRNFPEDVPVDFSYLVSRIIGHLESLHGLTDNAKLLSCGHLVDTEKFDLSNFGACPICQKQVNENDLLPSAKRKSLTGKTKLKVLGIAKENEIFEIFKNLLSSSTSISQSDKEDITSIFVTNKNEIAKHFPKEIPHKEILSFVAALVLGHLNDFSLLKDKVKNATDVLRIATAMSEGDVSLAKSSKFRKFARKERRFLLTLLENCKNIKEDMVRYAGNWIKLGEILHPGEYKTKYPNSFASFTAIRNGEKIETFNSKAEIFIKEKRVFELADHLKTRPSEFARKLDFIVSNLSNSGYENIINTFAIVVAKVPTPVLLQVMSNFRIRASHEKKIRIILPKGNLARVKVLEEERAPLKYNITNSIIDTIQTELKDRFAKYPNMGKVFIDDKLSTYMIPSSQRSASKALVTITRGSQVEMSADKFVRMFIYWKEPNGERTDIDLSAVMFDEDWNGKGHISFTNLKSTGAVHSGDIQSAPKGAAEFIDIEKKVLLNNGTRYVAMNIYGYTGQPFVEMPECFAGIMGRNSHKSGEIFEPKTVKQKFDVSSEASVAIPLILDLKENKMIWTDITLKSGGRYMAVESNKSGVQLMARALSEFVNFKTNLYDLLKLHAEARGTMVNSPEEADEVFSVENIPFNTERIMSEFLV